MSTGDGRALRGERTREAIVDALIALVEEGDVRPTAAAIAARASVSLRTIHTHFESLEALLLAASTRAMRVTPPTAIVPERDEPLDSVIARFVSARGEFLDATYAVRRAAEAYEPRSEVVGAVAATLRGARRSAVLATFERWLPKSGRARDDALDAIDVLASGVVWDELRRSMHVTRARAEAIVASMMRATLGVRA